MIKFFILTFFSTISLFYYEKDSPEEILPATEDHESKKKATSLMSNRLYVALD